MVTCFLHDDLEFHAEGPAESKSEGYETVEETCVRETKDGPSRMLELVSWLVIQRIKRSVSHD